MNDIDPKPKRKNDDKPKRRPGRILPILIGISAVVLVALVGIALWQPGYKPMSDLPAAIER